MAALFASTWGDPNATKRVLLIHGLAASSRTWHQVAPEFASQGKFHLNAPTCRALLRIDQYRLVCDRTRFARAWTCGAGIGLYRGDHPYDIVIGQSLGAIVVIALLPHLKSTRPVHVVLVDPPLEVAPEFHAMVTKNVVERLRNPGSPERYQQENPSWSREETVVCSGSDYLCDFTAATAILEVGLYILVDKADIRAYEARSAKLALVFLPPAADSPRQCQIDRTCCRPIHS
ncbi:hypothetical protein JVU11DRAFT_5829 [Chiua virens]|nr:hypothetical protein JVU11DRAFT_5829 [Chiua virens]